MEAARDFAEQNLLRSEGSVMAAVADVRRAREGPREARMATERMDEGDQRSGPEPENSSTSPPPDDLSSANPAVAADPAKETGASDSGCIDSTENHSSSQDQEGAVEDAGEAAARGQEHDHAQLDGQDLVREPAPGQNLVLHDKLWRGGHTHRLRRRTQKE